MPVAVGIGLTNECNLDCPHCYRPTLTRQRLSVPEVETILDNLDVGSVNLGVGENGVHPEYRRMLALFREREVKKKKGKKTRWVWTHRWEPIIIRTNCDDPCHTVTLDPSLVLLPNTDYVVVITNGVTDKIGHGMAQNYSWTFTTGSA